MNADDPRLTAMGLLAEAYAGLQAHLVATLTAHGLSGVEFEVLLRLGRSPGNRLRMTDLAAQTGLSTSGVTRVVDRLEESGTVRRESCAADRRGLFAALTEEGERRLAAVLPAHIADIEHWLTGPLTPAQLDALLDALRAIRDLVRPSATAGARACAAAAGVPDGAATAAAAGPAMAMGPRAGGSGRRGAGDVHLSEIISDH